MAGIIRNIFFAGVVVGGGTMIFSLLFYHCVGDDCINGFALLMSKVIPPQILWYIPPEFMLWVSLVIAGGAFYAWFYLCKGAAYLLGVEDFFEETQKKDPPGEKKLEEQGPIS